MTEFETEIEIDTSDLDDEYQHATCVAVHPFGSLKPGDLFKTVCGKERLLRASGNYPKCPECYKHQYDFMHNEIPCFLCNKTLTEHKL